eukprot:16431189-Heterocapsa_arctica.AAC.2
MDSRKRTRCCSGSKALKPTRKERGRRGTTTAPMRTFARWRPSLSFSDISATACVMKGTPPSCEWRMGAPS